MKNTFIFDVESTSLHGEGFAFSAIVFSPEGEIVDSLTLLSTEGAKKAGEWTQTNVLPHLSDIETVETTVELRTKFYAFYMKHRETSTIWSDCNFPVETNFLSAVVADDQADREWKMPFPLMDVSTLVFINLSRAEFYKNKTGTVLRQHHPYDDCLASYFALKNA